MSETILDAFNRLIVVDGVYQKAKWKTKEASALRLLIADTAFEEYFTIDEKIAGLKLQLAKRHKCSCGAFTKLRSGVFNLRCSIKCAANDKEVRDKTEKTNFEKYNAKSPTENDAIKQKIRDTMLKNHGVEICSQSEQIKQKIKQTNLEKYGNACSLHGPSVSAKTKQTNLEKYGHENPFGSPSIIEKSTNTLNERFGGRGLASTAILGKYTDASIDRYGVIHPSMAPAFKEQLQITSLEKYGVDCVLKVGAVREKGLKTKRKNYNADNWPARLEKIKNEGCVELSSDQEWVGADHKYEWAHLACGTQFAHSLECGISPRCPTCKPTSKPQQEIVDFIKSISSLELRINDRAQIAPLELDIFIPELNIAIEFNGVYWHSDHLQLDKKYHLNKTLLCEQKGIRLIHIFEDEWINKTGIVKSRIRNMFTACRKIFARKCSIREIQSPLKKEFLNEAHLQGNDSSSVHIGLFHQDELVQVMTFGKSRFNKNYQYELVRCASAIDCSVVGGGSKLLKYFIDTYNPESIITYADRRWSIGNFYNQLGFEHIHNSGPNYFYVAHGTFTRENRLKFQKHKLQNLLEVYDSSKTETENVLANGYYRLWDCGNMAFAWRSKESSQIN